MVFPMHDTEEDYFYSSDNDFCEEEDVRPLTDQERDYKILTEEDIQQRQEEEIREVSNVLDITTESSCLLLCHYKWKADHAKDEWFSDQERVRNAVGLLDQKQVITSKSPNYSKTATATVNCGICFEENYSCKITSLGCGHYYCDECWKCYFTTAINDGPGCLMLKCPDPSCLAAVGKDMIDKLALDVRDRAKYIRYLTRSYVQNHPAIKWCPAPGCEYAVELYDVGGSGLGYDVVCGCSSEFCWNCSEEAHRPVDCQTVSNWKMKHSSEEENTTWILAYTKPCPKCKRAIEKNMGCMHMTCREPCKYHFCWLCLGPSPHSAGPCNGYKESSVNGEEKKRKMAKGYLDRFTHYYERWTSNHSSREKAKGDLNKMCSKYLGELSEVVCQTDVQLTFIIEAWQQIIECRRVLKWTYAYGFYLSADELPKKQLFEYLQGQAEAGLERLHRCAETDLMKYLQNPHQEVLENFNDFRFRLVNLTKVTRTYFENLVRALENGLSDVHSQETNSRVNSGLQEFGSQAATSKRNGREGNTSLQEIGSQEATSMRSTSMISSASTTNAGEWLEWTCDQCTYLNAPSATTCAMCLGVSQFMDTYEACPHCTYLNEPSATTCAMCHQAR